MQLCTSAGRPL